MPWQERQFLDVALVGFAPGQIDKRGEILGRPGEIFDDAGRAAMVKTTRQVSRLGLAFKVLAGHPQRSAGAVAALGGGALHSPARLLIMPAMAEREAKGLAACAAQPMQRPGSAGTDRAGRLLLRLTALAVVVGIAARLALYLARRSFWGDEAFLLLNLRNYDAWRLLTGRLDYVPNTQAGPPLFLLILKGMTRFTSGPEYAMRLLPLVCSCLALAGFAWLARRVLHPAVALAAVAMLALSDKVIVQAATVKQYSGDVLMTVVLLGLILLRRPADPFRRLLLCAAAATVGLWFSHSTIFVFAAISLAMLPTAWRGGVRGMVKYALIQAPVAVSFVFLFLFSIRVQRDPYLDAFWAKAFFDWTRPWLLPIWLIQRLWEVWTYGVHPIGGLLLIPAGLAVARLWKGRQWELLAMLVGPLGLVIVAAAAHQYPLSAQRITLFLIPLQILLAGLGVEAMMQKAPSARGQRIAAAAGLLLIAVAAAASAADLLPAPSTHFRPAIEYLRRHRRPGEGVYVVGEDLGAVVRVYWPGLDERVKLEADPNLPIRERHFWVFFRPDRYDSQRLIRAQAPAAVDGDRTWRPKTGGWAICFDAAGR